MAQYLEMTGQKLVADPNAKVDAHGGASGSNSAPASEPTSTDADAGASDSEETSAPSVEESAVDTNAGASGEEEETTTPAAPVAKVETSAVDTEASASSEEDDAANGIPDSVDTDAGASD